MNININSKSDVKKFESLVNNCIDEAEDFFNKVEQSNSEIEKRLELCKLCTPVEAFEVEGTIYKGYFVDVVKEYLRKKPSDKFIIWLDNNIQILQ